MIVINMIFVIKSNIRTLRLICLKYFNRIDKFVKQICGINETSIAEGKKCSKGHEMDVFYEIPQVVLDRGFDVENEEHLKLLRCKKC